jgi:hypothetical protein
LGSGYADLVAVDTEGMPTVIEVKLASNDESRRAVVTQVLSYAASLFRSSLRDLQGNVLEAHLARQGLGTIAEAVAPIADGRLDGPTFEAALEENLRVGRLRVVIVLDDAPEELVALVGFLEAVTDHLSIDLVTVSQYEVGGETLLIPQRLDPGRVEATKPSTAGSSRSVGQLTDGSGRFREALGTSSPEAQAFLGRLATWAEGLASHGTVRLQSYEGKGGITTLLPRFRDEGVGLVTIYRDAHSGYLQFWRNVIVRRAPASLVAIESSAEPAKVGQGTVTHEVSDDLLQALTGAYEEAARGQVSEA